MSPAGLYLYAVVPADAGSPRTTGLEGAPLRVVCQEAVGVLVSDVATAPVKVNAANLRTHQQVVDESHLTSTTLPFRFGVVADSEEALFGSSLAERAAVLAGKLEDFGGLTEMRVTASYAGDAALRELVSQSRRLQRLRESIGRRPEAATYYERIALGEEVANGLAALREGDGAYLSRSIAPYARVEQRLESSDEKTALRAAYLVEQRRLAAFEQAVEELSGRQAGRLEFQLTGPMAPWDFVELDRGDLQRQSAALAGGGRSRGRWGS